MRRRLPCRALAEVETAPDVIEATVNYVENNGERLFTYTGEPGSNDRRRGGTYDPRQVKIHNGRLEVDRFKLERDGFRFVRSPDRDAAISTTRTKSAASTTRR